MNNATKVGLSVVVAGIVAVASLSGPTTNRVFVSGLATGRGTIADPLDLVVYTDSSITGTGSAGSAFSAATAEASVTAAAFGYAKDGDVTYSVDTTLSEDVFAHDMTIDAGKTLNPNGWRIWVTGTLTLNGNIERNGADGATGSGSGLGIGACVAATGGLGLVGGTLPGQTGSPGINGLSSATSMFPTASNTGGAGGAAGVGGSSGTDGLSAGNGGSGGGGGGATGAGAGASGGNSNVTAQSTSNGAIDMQMAYSGRFKTTILTIGSGGGAGGCGGQCGGGNTPAKGGGGGGIGGYIVVFAKSIVGAGHIWAKGGNGGNGGSTAAACSGGAGGGAGGPGGVILIVIGGGTFPTASVAGGSKGTGTGGNNGAGGADGGNGSAGYLIEYKAGF